MPPLKGAILELDADVDGTGQTTGTFRFGAEAGINSRSITDYIADRRGSALNSVVGSSVDSYGGDRTAFYVDLGAGTRVWEIRKKGWTGSSETWGDGSGVFDRDATGSDASHQAELLERYHDRGEFDSRGRQARLQYGHVSEQGGFSEDHVPVTVRECEFDRVADEPGMFDISITLARAGQLDDVLDIASQVGF